MLSQKRKKRMRFLEFTSYHHTMNGDTCLHLRLIRSSGVRTIPCFLFTLRLRQEITSYLKLCILIVLNDFQLTFSWPEGMKSPLTFLRFIQVLTSLIRYPFQTSQQTVVLQFGKQPFQFFSCQVGFLLPAGFH